MSYSRLERREKRIIKDAVKKAEEERDEAKVAAEKVKKEIDEIKDILCLVAQNMDDNGCVTLDKDTFDKILAITAKY